MFKNIGKKIKTLARVICILGIVVCAIVGIVLAITATVIGGVCMIIFGAVFSWIGSFALYGFGDLIDKVNEIAINTRHTEKVESSGEFNFDFGKNNEKKSDSDDSFSTEKNSENETPFLSGKKCPSCNNLVVGNSSRCPFCGEILE